MWTVDRWPGGVEPSTEWSFEELAGLLTWVADDDELYARVERVIEDKAAWGTYEPARVVGVRELAESEWQDAHHADYVSAESVTRGHMVRGRSAARGVCPEDLWTRSDWARHATEEMHEWFALHGRMTKRAFLLAFYAQNREPETVQCVEPAPVTVTAAPRVPAIITRWCGWVDSALTRVFSVGCRQGGRIDRGEMAMSGVAMVAAVVQDTYLDVMGRMQHRVTGAGGRRLVTAERGGWIVWRPDSIRTEYRAADLQRAIDYATRAVS